MARCEADRAPCRQRIRAWIELLDCVIGNERTLSGPASSADDENPVVIESGDGEVPAGGNGRQCRAAGQVVCRCDRSCELLKLLDAASVCWSCAACPSDGKQQAVVVNESATAENTARIEFEIR